MLIKKAWRNFWGVIPLTVVLLCGFAVAVIEKASGDTFRTVPGIFLMGAGIAGFGALLWWGNTGKRAARRKPRTAAALRVVSGVLFALVVWAGVFVAGFSYQPEHIVTRGNIKMVASVRSFLDEFVMYYEYKNPLFYGKNLGYEYYGSGGNDPLVSDPKPSPVRWAFFDPDGNVIDCGPKEAFSEKH